MQLRFKWLRAAPERRKEIIDEISFGSDPRPSFYLLLIASALIASFGLVANSTAVIIGAMVVSPLMTPILGISLGLVRSDSKLLGRALSAEVLGIILAIIVSTFFGLIPLAIEPTSEMLLRTEPNLLDLLVAVFAGLAGSYAMVDERISPALPGVAIATAIVPPLANTGLCIALGAYDGAIGSFLLFVANFFSILVVASLVFVAAGLERRTQDIGKMSYVKRFGIAVTGFLAVAVFLTHSLNQIIESRYTKLTLARALKSRLSRLFDVSLINEIHNKKGDILHVLATVQTPHIINPRQVKQVQDALVKEMGLPIELVVRNILAKDMTATGTTGGVTEQNLDGSFIKEEREDRSLKIEKAEQVLWNELADRPDLRVASVDYGLLPLGPVLMVSLYGAGSLTKDDVARLEDLMRERLDDQSVRLIISHIEPELKSTRGKLLYGWSYFGKADGQTRRLIDDIDLAVQRKFTEMPNTFPVEIYHTILENRWDILVEVMGPKVLTPADVKSIEADIRRLVPKPLNLYIWSRADTLINNEGYQSFTTITEKRKSQFKSIYFEKWSSEAADTAE
jgi:uncharacterized hydrophobic protein (TIGR00271 family)